MDVKENYIDLLPPDDLYVKSLKFVEYSPQLKNQEICIKIINTANEYITLLSKYEIQPTFLIDKLAYTVQHAEETLKWHKLKQIEL